MNPIHLVLLVFSFVCAVLGTFGVPSGRINFIAASLAFLVASMLF